VPTALLWNKKSKGLKSNIKLYYWSAIPF